MGPLAVFLVLAMLLVIFIGIPAEGKKCPPSACDPKWTKVTLDPTTEYREVRGCCGWEKVGGIWKKYCIYAKQKRTCTKSYQMKNCWTQTLCKVTGDCEVNGPLPPKTCCSSSKCSKWSTYNYEKRYV